MSKLINVADASLGISGLSLPLWLIYVQSAFAVYVVLASAVLLTLRVRAAWRDRNKEE